MRKRRTLGEHFYLALAN